MVLTPRSATSGADAGLELVSPSQTWVIGEPLQRSFDRLGCWDRVEELQRTGYTVIPGALSERSTSRVREVIRRCAVPAAQRTRQADVWNLFAADPVITEAVLDERALAFADLVCGKGMLVSMKGLVRSSESEPLGLHAENAAWLPSPYSPHNFVCSIMLTCDDFHEAAGGTGFVPGSHLTGEDPTAEVAADLGGVVVPYAPAGSLVVWLGGTWHGADRRQLDGDRVSLLSIFGRPSLRPGQDLRSIVIDGGAHAEELELRLGRRDAFERRRGARPSNGAATIRWTRGLPDGPGTLSTPWGETSRPPATVTALR